MIVNSIESKEQRFIAVGDVKGAFLMPHVPDFTTSRFVNEQVDAMSAIGLSFKNYLMNAGKTKVLHVILNTSLCGIAQAALLWHRLYSTTLVDLGFKLNQHNLCVANKNINGKQLAIMWHVDDSKISHVNEVVVRDIVAKIESKFGDTRIVHGLKKEFLGVKLECRSDGNFSIDVKLHLLKACESFKEELTKSATPAKNGLFEVDITSSCVDGPTRKRFH